MTHGVMDGNATMRPRAGFVAFGAALGLFVLAGSISGVSAADAPAAPAVEAPAADSDAADSAGLIRFEPSADAFEAGFADYDEPTLEEDIGDGVASWYGRQFAGRKTASGERFDPAAYTAAHRTLPFGSKVRVSHGGKSVVVRINDRGPFHGNRVIDLSRAAAEELGLVRAGKGRVELALLAD